MAMLHSDLSLLEALQLYINQIVSDGFHVHLYDNNYTPVNHDVVGSFSEAGYSGYASQVGPAFTTAAMLGNDAQAYCVPLVWVYPGGGSVSIYGYFVTSDTDGHLLWAERSPSAPVVLVNPGDPYVVELALLMGNHA